MWKHFLSKLPKKALKSESVDSARGNSGPLGPNASPNLGSGRPNSSALRRTSSVVFPASVIAGIEPLISFKDVPSSEKMNLFISKLSLCCVDFDFRDPTKNVAEKELKRATLFELLDFVSSNPPKFSEPAILAMCKTCAVNLFRVFPPNYRSSNSHASENEDDEPTFDPAWPHLQIVYDLLLKFVTSSSLEAKVAKKVYKSSLHIETARLV